MVKEVFVIQTSVGLYVREFNDGKDAYLSGLAAEAKRFATHESALRFSETLYIEGLHKGMLFRIEKYLTHQP